jgi:uncharacterized protein YdeI (YjbR/CyaY-like superfamily)
MPTKTKRVSKTSAAETPVMSFASRKAWQTWIARHHATSKGVWLQIAKQGADRKSVTYPEALDVSLCYGWIDGQRKSFDEDCYLQKFTPRTPKSIWSKINCDKVQALIAKGEMQAAGLAAIERAKADGRWNAAYAGQRTMTVPDDLQAALDRDKKAAAFFTTLNSQNRYAILFRIHNAKKAETRARRIDQFVRMLARHETIYPQAPKK